MKTKGSTKSSHLLRRVISTNMSPLELERLKRLLAYMIQFNSVKFGDAVPQEYVDATKNVVEALIPNELRQMSYASYMLQAPISHYFLADSVQLHLPTIIRRTLSPNVSTTLEQLMHSKLYELPEISDIESSYSADSPPQQVPDLDDTHRKSDQ